MQKAKFLNYIKVYDQLISTLDADGVDKFYTCFNDFTYKLSLRVHSVVAANAVDHLDVFLRQNAAVFNDASKYTPENIERTTVQFCLLWSQFFIKKTKAGSKIKMSDVRNALMID